MIETYYTFVFRFGQATLDAALTLVMGVIVAGVFRRMVGPAATRRLFGRGLTGSLRGWAAGMLLPVCSLGVIPVARELRRGGVPGGTVLAFVLTAPLLNPISFLYGLTLGEPKVILGFAAITLGKTAVVAWMWEAWFGGAADKELAIDRATAADAEAMPTAGLRRVLAVLVTAAKELAGRDIFYYLVGLTGNAVLSSLLPHGALQYALGHHDKFAPLRMLALSIPAYMSPLSGMIRIGTMFEHGNSIAAAFVLLVFGIGMCLGTLLWLVRDFGRRILPWFALYALIVLGLGYACEPLLWNPAKMEADHTHAFDDLTSPFFRSQAADPAVMKEIVYRRLARQFDPPAEVSLYCLGALLAAGIALKIADRKGRVERWLVADPTERTHAWDVRLSGTFLGVNAIAGLIAFSVVGAYVYFPDRGFCLDRMHTLAADTRDLVRSGQVDESARSLEQWDLTARQLQVGVFIRSFKVTLTQDKSTDELREGLEAVRDDLRAGRKAEAAARLDEIIFQGAYRDCLKSYRL